MLHAARRPGRPRVRPRGPLAADPRHRERRRAIVLVPLAVASIAVTVLAIVRPGAWASLVALLVAPAIMISHGADRRRVVLMSLTVAATVAAIDYVAWRFLVVNWSAWWLAVPLVLAELFGVLHALGVSYTTWPRPPLRLRTIERATRLPIFIMIPTVDEGAEVVRETAVAARRAAERLLEQHPEARVRVVICNDGKVAGYDGWTRIEALGDELDVEVITRSVGGGAKAGNIENARRRLDARGGTLLVIFDADQVAHPDFLLRTVPRLDDPRVAWVQTGQYYRNLDNPVSRWAEDQQAIFYGLLCEGKSALNSAFICGTNVVLRGDALEEIGGFPQDSVTEDFAASLALHSRWKSVFVPGKLATGLGPMDLPAFFKQQSRWALGTLGTLRTHFIRLLLSRRLGMTFAQRIQYLLASTHYLGGLKDLIFVVAPLVFLATGIPAVAGATLADFLWHFVPYFVLSQAAFWWTAARITSVRGVLMGFASFPVLISSLFTVVTGKKVSFAVTAKARSGSRSVRHLVPHALGVAASAVIVVVAVMDGKVGPAQSVSLVWVAYTAICFLAVLALGIVDLAGVTTSRTFRARNRARSSGRRRRPISIAIAISVVAAAAVIWAMLPPPTSAVAFDGHRPQTMVGLSLPGAGEATTPDGSLGIVGRTQLLSESFDATWADHVSAAGGIPWITLVLGSAPRLNTGLASVVNGVHDDQFATWARQIRDYRRPIYLGLFPHVDRDWSVTSAVANGGIPQDVASAWQRVRQIFDREGATNVAWVWSPADPAHDSQFAPDPAQVDVVLDSLISYPGTQWADPAESLRDVERQHPGVPVLLEVSAAGAAPQKSAWLQSVGAAVAADHAVVGLVYHDAPPTAESGSGHEWSWRSDPASEAVVAGWIGHAPGTTP
jgi:cellulose synthase/poly-beta-1,6-N-acetylglucosamine synthase-like glycosyltransferase